MIEMPPAWHMQTTDAFLGENVKATVLDLAVTACKQPAILMVVISRLDAAGTPGADGAATAGAVPGKFNNGTAPAAADALRP